MSSAGAPKPFFAINRKPQSDRLLGNGPPWLRMGRTVLYPIEGFRAWLKANERQPVRAARREANT